MTAAFLQSELTSLIQDSKRRQSDVRTAAERSLADLKAIHVTSETQLAGDLWRRPQFIEPFILACRSKYIKLAVTAAVCLQRLVASKAISPSRLADVLDAFQDAAQQGLDVQLKILQALPSLLQLYATELQGDAFAKVLSLCALLTGSKTALVSSTATATFQQLVASLFEKQNRTRADENSEDEDVGDAPKVFDDMCLIVSGEQPRFLRAHGLTLPLALEVIELSLSNPKADILNNRSCATICESHLIPGIVQILEKSSSFSTFGRGLRVLYLLTTKVLERMLDPLSDSFIEILNITDRPSNPPWRRLLCLEYMRNVISESQLFRKVFALFDCDESRRSIVGDLMSTLVRIASEDPALIGLGRQSTIPTNSENEGTHVGSAHVDVDAVGNVLQAGANVTGISSKWSMLDNTLLEQASAQVTPDIPETYIYTLILGSVASLSDGLSKYVMPFSVPIRSLSESAEGGDSDSVPARKNSQFRRAEKYQRLLNPLKREDLSSKEEIIVCAKLIENCWPAILATCSTFLNSALDSHFYHVLVRTVQKLAQVSGVLELFTPRDALLTTLAKVSVPVNASSVVTAVHGNKLARNAIDDDDDADATDESSLKSPVPTTPRLSVDVSRQPLNVRNLLCLRALLNLGIALGPTLSETSWFIIIQASQQADALMSVNPATRSAVNKSQQIQDEVDTEGQTNLGSEITAVGTASKRMLESTRSYSDESLEIFLRSVFKMIETLTFDSAQAIPSNDMNGKKGLSVAPRRHRATRSVSGAFTTASVLHVEAEFVLKTINDLARINLHRFCSTSSRSCTWDLVVARLLLIVADHDINAQLRLQAASTLESISMETVRMLEKLEKDADELDKLQNLCLNCLARQISLLYRRRSIQAVLVTDIDIHRRVLEALENVVSHSGDSLTSGWRTVFDILQQSTKQESGTGSVVPHDAQAEDQEQILERTIPTAFRVVQLIVSDFLSTIDPVSFSILVQLLPLFGIQKNDLNISLTTTVLFSNLSSLLLERTETIELSPILDSLSREVDHRLITVEQRATDVSSLWFAIVRQLCRLCKDGRGDVRNSALHVLIRTFESSSSQLSANAWNVSLREAVVPVLNSYTGNGGDLAARHVSYAQLLQGIVDLLVQNIKKITTSTEFAATWKALVSVLEAKLAEQSLDGHQIVFLSAAELLRALHETGVHRNTFTLAMLQTWFINHPARIPIENKSNQDALNAHARLFRSIIEHSDGEVVNFTLDGQSLVYLAMTATKQTALSSIHPPYSSDVTKLAPEQSAIIDNMRIIKSMLASRRNEYTVFVLDLINSILIRNTATEVEQQQITAGAKSMKRPTLMALMFRCLAMVREVIREEADKENFLHTTSAPETLLVLAKIVATKYVGMPSSSDVQVWKEASKGATELVETAQPHNHCMQAKDVEAFSQPLVQGLASILGAPALEAKTTPPYTTTTAAAASTTTTITITPEVVATDEAFDIEQCTGFHRAAETFLQLPSFPEQARKQYVLQLFHTSFVAKPWHGDLPSNLENDPLAKLKELRRGSVRAPDLFRRGRIPFEALNALFDLVDSSRDNTITANKTATAQTAAAYVLLRIAHPLKQFQSDQKLRNLIPPPKPLLRELSRILRKALDLKVIDEAFDAHAISTSSSSSSSSPNLRDGKSHLRILCPLVLKFKTFWVELPRVRVCAWQDEEDALAVWHALEGWVDKCIG